MIIKLEIQAHSMLQPFLLLQGKPYLKSNSQGFRTQSALRFLQQTWILTFPGLNCFNELNLIKFILRIDLIRCPQENLLLPLGSTMAFPQRSKN